MILDNWFIVTFIGVPFGLFLLIKTDTYLNFIIGWKKSSGKYIDEEKFKKFYRKKIKIYAIIFILFSVFMPIYLKLTIENITKRSKENAIERANEMMRDDMDRKRIKSITE